MVVGVVKWPKMSQIESVLRGLASTALGGGAGGGGHSPGLKKALLAKTLCTKTIYDPVTSLAEITSLLRMFLEWVLETPDPSSDQQSHLVEHGKQQFARLAGLRPSEFRDHFVSPNLIIDIFTNSMYSNKVRAPVSILSY